MKKLNMPNIRALLPQPKPRKPRTRLQASASRLTQPVYDDYEEEPTTKLSTAFVVVLVLHLVAVGGIYAFHSIKAHRREADGTAVAANAGAAKKTALVQAAVGASATNKAVAPAIATKSPVVAPPTAAAAPSPAALAPVQTAPVKPAASGGVVDKTQVAAQTAPSAVLPQPKAAASAPVVAAAKGTAPVGPATTESSGRTYTVVKGDNPVTIAKKMGVNSEELLKLNGLDDPKKLQIGQVLKVPAKK
ncbi:MAG: LysM domain [Pseudomonadota bacterium]|jgi:LysM repeat protein